jgi:hypothetical protein
MASICRAFVVQPTLAVLPNTAGTLGRDQQAPCRDHPLSDGCIAGSFTAGDGPYGTLIAKKQQRYRASVSITYQFTAHRDVGG